MSDLPQPIAEAIRAANERFPTTRSRLEDLIRIPSCSFPGSDPQHLNTAANATADWLRAIGMPEVSVLTGDWPPYVLARDHRAGPDKPTILLYSHYDVQPPLREALWDSPPYEPTERNGRLYGRGSGDDKAGIAATIGACDAWLHDGKLPCNVTVWIEGEEEVGSPHLNNFLAKHIDDLTCDAIVIADVGNVATGIPTMTISLRGMASANLTVKALHNPLHSGMWGGPVPDPITILCRLCAQLADERNRPLLPGITIPEPDPAWLAALSEVPYDASAIASSMGLTDNGRSIAQDKIDVMRRLWYEPCFSVNAIHSGGQPGEAGNVIMDEAWARVSIRTAPGMDENAVATALEARCRELCPDTVELIVEPEATAPAWSTSVAHPLFDACRTAFEHGYGRQPVTVGCGGTIPFVGTLSERLGGVPALLVPVEDPDTRPHAENESVHLGDLRKTTASLAAFLGLAVP